MNEINNWLRRVTEYYNISAKNLVRFGLWFVNDDGDIFVNINEYQTFGSWPIYCDQLNRGQSFDVALHEWLMLLDEKIWMQGTKEVDFVSAFTRAWNRSAYTDKEDKGFRHSTEQMADIGVRLEIESKTPQGDAFPDWQLTQEGSEDADSRYLLEFSEEQQQFYFNSLCENGEPFKPQSQYYEVVAETTWMVGGTFTDMMRARMLNGAIFTLDQVVAEWNYYVFLLVRFSNSVHLYGGFRNPTNDDIQRIKKRINLGDGEFEDNEMMKLRTIGVPKIKE